MATTREASFGTARRPAPSVADREAKGRAARAAVPRSSHAAWAPALDRPDPISVLEAQETPRVPELVPLRHARMLASPFAFFRGAAAVMAADLATTPTSGIRVQACGDAHLVNFGGYESPERSQVFDINDFDETTPGPWEWDVKRLAASVAVAARDLGHDETAGRAAVACVVGSYREAMRDFAGQRDLEVWYARLDSTAVADRWSEEITRRDAQRVRRMADKALTKDSVRALASLAERVDGRLRIVSEPPVIVRWEDLVAPNGADEAIGHIRAALRSYRRTLQPDRAHLLDGYRIVDLARKVVGVGSVGTRCWIVLLLGRDENDPLFLQIKEAEASVLEPFVGRSGFTDHGQRVVEGQRLMQSASDIFLGWSRDRFDGVEHHYYVRQLWDGKMSPNLSSASPQLLSVYGKICGWTLARAHARSGDRIAIASYLGTKDVFDRAIVEFAVAYTEQNTRDHAAMAAAVESGRLAVA
jgi:uncharacterized protein (DUF2252 family)